jgi:hypothetical protein
MIHSVNRPLALHFSLWFYSFWRWLVGLLSKIKIEEEEERLA